MGKFTCLGGILNIDIQPPWKNRLELFGLSTQRDQAVGIRSEYIDGARSAWILAQRERAAQPAKIGPAFQVCCEQAQGSLLEMDLQTGNGLDPGVFTGGHKLDGPGEKIVIG